MKKNNKVVATVKCRGIHTGGRNILADLDFKWRTGEQWGIIGPNGSGKSLFLHILSGDYYSDDADVTFGFNGIDGREPNERVSVLSLEKQREVLESFEAYAQMRWNSSEEESTPLLKDWLDQDSIEGVLPYEIISRTSKIKVAFDARRNRILKTLKIGDLSERRLAALSNGEMRRAFLAYALLQSPKIMALDAPFTGLDATSRQIVADVITDVAEKGNIHTIFASAFAEELPSSVTHVLELDQEGCVVYQGPKRKSDIVAARKSSGVGLQTPKAAKVTISRDMPEDLTAKPVVEMHDVSVKYGDIEVFSHLNWTVRSGERWLLAGPNGSGKTTIIALIQGDHQQAYSNDVRIFGRRRGSGESIWSIKKKIGWVSPELHECIDAEQTVLDVVLSGFIDSPFGGSVRGRVKHDTAMKELADCGLANTAKERFGSLSSGQQRLVLLARALVKKPPVLLLDEPCQNLDRKNISKFLSTVDAVCEGSKTTIIYVTHVKSCVPKCVNCRIICKPSAAK